MCYSQLVESEVNTLTQGERVRYIRKHENVNLTLEKFGERIGLKKSSLSQIENNVNSLTDSNIKAICREFRVNESWLRYGEGDPFKPLPEEDETAAYVSDLLEDDDNPLYIIIKETMKTFHELSPKSQEAFCEFSKKLLDNLTEHKKKES